MRLFARDGSVVDKLRRQSDWRTTKKACSSDQFEHRFAGLVMTAETIGEIAIGGIGARPYSIAFPSDVRA